MDGLVESLTDELNCNVVFTIPLFGGIDVLGSVVVTWIIMVMMMVGSPLLAHGLRVGQINNKRTASESGLSFIHDFFEDLLGKNDWDYIPYLITVVLCIGTANMIGLSGFKSPTKNLNVAVSLTVMSIVLVEAVGIRKRGVKGWVKNFAEPIAITAPINVLELSIRPLSLYMRLLDNVLGIIVVMALIEHLLPLIASLPFSFCFDIFDEVIQTCVFVFLTSLHIKEAAED